MKADSKGATHCASSQGLEAVKGLHPTLAQYLLHTGHTADVEAAAQRELDLPSHNQCASGAAGPVNSR